eukprot:COSAG06_NODE_60579_length_270_cov_0.894737_2_plen_31_part_01
MFELDVVDEDLSDAAAQENIDGEALLRLKE